MRTNNKAGFYRKAVACGLALSMAFPFNALAAVQQSSEITGENTVEEGIFDVTLPTEVTFAIDPMELLNTVDNGSTDAATDSNQVASSNFLVINQSNYPVQVDAYTSLKLNSDIKLTNDLTKVAETSTDKVIYMGIGSLTSAGVTHGAIDDPIVIKPEYSIKNLTSATVGDEKVQKAVAETSKTTTSYKYDTKTSCVLDKVAYTEGVKSGTVAVKNVGGFTFYGKINTRASWAVGDLTARVVFDINGMSGSKYTNTARVASTLNALEVVGATTPTLPTSTTVTAAADKTVATDFEVHTTLTDPAASKATKVVRVEVYKGADLVGELPIGSYTSTYDATPQAEKIEFVAGKGTMSADELVPYQDMLVKDNIINVTFDDGMTSIITIPAVPVGP